MVFGGGESPGRESGVGERGEPGWREGKQRERDREGGELGPERDGVG